MDPYTMMYMTNMAYMNPMMMRPQYGMGAGMGMGMMPGQMGPGAARPQAPAAARPNMPFGY